MAAFSALTNELKAAGVNMNYVKINETPQDSSFCILNYGDEIECFYSERGAKFELKSFSNVDDSIRYFKKWIMSIDFLRKY
jgi:sugar/nucleoside kinase (ribokinase family)